MNCVVINLPDQTRRWDAMAVQCSAAALAFRRFEAVRGAELSPTQLSVLYSPERNRRQHFQPLNPGEIGCYASHVGVWRALLESSDPQWAVFEDDVRFHNELAAVLHAIPALSGEWELIKLIGRSNEKITAVRNWFSNHRLIRYRRVPSFCSAYVINRRGAERMLAAHVPFGRPVDLDIRCWWESGCRILGVLPYPVSLSPLSDASIIGDRKSRLGFSAKLHRLWLRYEYSFRNWQANRTTDAASFPLLPEWFEADAAGKATAGSA